jgi:Tfp pilus assembly protein PilF
MAEIVADRVLSAVRGVALALLLGAAACVGTACLGSGAKAPRPDRVRMAETEYDLARDLWLSKNQPREALDHALKAAKLDEHNADVAHLLALLYLDFCSRETEECLLDSAEAQARRALKLDANYRDARNTLGVILIHAKKYDEAVAALKPLTADILYATPEKAWGNLGLAYLELGRFQEAVDALERSVAAQPLFCVGHYRLGLAYEKSNQYAKAAEAFSRAVETDEPGCRNLQPAFAGRGRVLAKIGDTDGARADLERCIELEHRNDTGKECSSMLLKLK